MKDFKKEIEHRKENGLFRLLGSSSGTIDFLSNDYLGLAQNVLSFSGSNGATGSRLLSGNNSQIELLESQIAQYHKAESALLFNSGYTANLGLISCIASRTDTLIMDELCHASLIDGALLSRANRLKFKHNDLKDLKLKLDRATGVKFVIIESVYSMDGTTSSIGEIIDICKQNDALLIIDEAHSIDITSEAENSSIASGNKVIQVVTFGKAFGSHGAAILCSQEIKEFLINFSRPFIYTTAPSPHQVEGIRLAYEQIKKADRQRGALKRLINHWNENKPNDLHWIKSDTQIQSLVVSGNEKTIALSNELQSHGFSVLPIRKPTVKEGTERIRFCLHSFNTTQEIDSLFLKLSSWKAEN